MSLLRVDGRFAIFNTGTLARKIVFTSITVALIFPLIYRSYQIFRADRIIRAEQTIESYSRALRHDPSNATLWWHRGRLRHYSLENPDIPTAINDYREALLLNPRLSQAWVDLADCYEKTERYADAEDALNKAIATHTYSPITQWQAGNFFLRRGNLPRMYECFKTACAYDPEKLGIAIDVAWKVDPDRAGILQKLLPDNLAANLSYLSFLVARDELDLAHAAWKRCLENEVPQDSEFKAAAAFNYIDRLLNARRVDEALVVWDEALRKAGSPLRDSRIRREGPPETVSQPPNLVWNGSFENEVLRGGFDWRYPDMQDVQFKVDLSNRMEGLKCFKVTFGGTNVAFWHLSQIVPIPSPGEYILEFYLRTEGLTTDQTPYMAIYGYPDASGAALRGAHFPESTEWRRMSATFTVKQSCGAIRLALQRDPSTKFDNLLKGSVWLDGVSIRAATAAGAADVNRGEKY